VNCKREYIPAPRRHWTCTHCGWDRKKDGDYESAWGDRKTAPRELPEPIGPVRVIPPSPSFTLLQTDVLQERIVRLLVEEKQPMTARSIAARLDVSKTDINRVLYRKNGLFQKNDAFLWTLTSHSTS
jgi:hypothetical protein